MGWYGGRGQVSGAFAAKAAYLSAASAREAKEYAAQADIRAGLREISATAGAILVEHRRIASGVDHLKVALNTLAAFSGSTHHSRFEMYRHAGEERGLESKQLANDAELFANGALSLKDSGIEEIERVRLRLMNSLKQIESIRIDLDNELADINAQNAQARERLDRTRLGR